MPSRANIGDRPVAIVHQEVRLAPYRAVACQGQRRTQRTPDITRDNVADTEGPGDVPTDSTAKAMATELQTTAVMAGWRARVADSGW